MDRKEKETQIQERRTLRFRDLLQRSEAEGRGTQEYSDAQAFITNNRGD